MTRGRDTFAHLERMRQEIDDLFDDVWARAGFPRRQRGGFRPRVDVYYCGETGEPSKAVVVAELPGIDVAGVSLEVRGRTLIISGERIHRDTEGRVYQQVEIEHGRFSREIALGTDVDAKQARATYEDGMLRIVLPLVRPPSGTPQASIADGGEDEA
jgi:HSP20 family protein